MKRNKKTQMCLLIFKETWKDNPGNEIGYLQRVGVAGGWEHKNRVEGMRAELCFLVLQ